MTTQLIQVLWAGLLVAFALVWLVRSALRPERAGLLGIAYFFFCMQFCAGMVLSSFAESYFRPQDVALTYAGVSLFWIGALGLGKIIPSPLPRVDYQTGTGLAKEKGIFLVLTEASLRIRPFYLAVVWLASLGVRLAGIFVFGIGLSGTFDTAKALAMPYWFLALWDLGYYIAPPMVFLVVICLLYRRPGTAIFITILLTEVLYSFTQNRRALIMLLFLSMFAMLIYHGRIRAKTIGYGLVTLVILWTIIFPFFFSIRRQWQDNSNATLGEWISTAWSQTISGKAAGTSDDYSNTVLQRMSALQFNHTVSNHMNDGALPLNGDIIKNAVAVSIPRVFNPDKFANATGEDSLVNKAFGMPDVDQMSNLPVFGQADFGLPGCLLYGVIFAGVLRLMELMLRTVSKRSAIGVLVLFAVVGNCPMQMEFTLSDFLAIFLRSAIFWWVVILVASMFFGAQPSGDETAAEGEPESEESPAEEAVAQPAGTAEQS